MLSYNKLKVNNKDFRNFYKRETKSNVKGRLHEYTNDKIIRLFLNKVANYIVEHPAGVYIDRIGYFHVYMIPYERVSRFNGKINPRYKLTFVPTDRSIFRYWSMDYQFRNKIVNNFNKKIKDGYRYLNLSDSVSNIDPYIIGKKIKK